MTVEGVRKAGIISGGIIAVTTLALKAEPSMKTCFATVCITLLAIVGASIQGWLDSKKPKDV